MELKHAEEATQLETIGFRANSWGVGVRCHLPLQIKPQNPPLLPKEKKACLLFMWTPHRYKVFFFSFWSTKKRGMPQSVGRGPPHLWTPIICSLGLQHKSGNVYQPMLSVSRCWVLSCESETWWDVHKQCLHTYWYNITPWFRLWPKGFQCNKSSPAGKSAAQCVNMMNRLLSISMTTLPA